MEHIKDFESFLNEARGYYTYNSNDLWVPKSDAHIHEADWKKLWDYLKEEYRRGNEIDAMTFKERNIRVDYSKLSNYWKKWFDANMVRIEKY